MLVTVKVVTVKAIAEFFNSQITDACSAQSAHIFVSGLSSVLLQNSWHI